MTFEVWLERCLDAGKTGSWVPCPGRVPPRFPSVEASEPVTGDYPDSPRLPLVTASEAREAVGYLLLLESLDVTPQGRAAGELARALASRLPA